jgi:uncharacterized membrane protein YdjX (TVP38/TMEM64 family)
MEKKSYTGRLLLFALLAAVIFILYNKGIGAYITIEYFKQNIALIQEAIHAHYFRSVIIFIASLTVGAALSLPLGVIVPLAGGMLFGFFPGGLYAVIGATIGGMIAFLSSRYLIGEFFQERFKERLHKFNHELHEYGYIYLLGLHFFPVTPFFVLNILSGLTKVPVFTFFWTTIVGVSPSFFIYSYIGSHLVEINEFKDIFSKQLIFAFIALKLLSAATILIGRFSKKRSKN